MYNFFGLLRSFNCRCFKRAFSYPFLFSSLSLGCFFCISPLAFLSFFSLFCKLCQKLHKICKILRAVVNQFFIRFFHQSHNTVLFGGLFTLKQWIISSLKHDTVPRVNKLYCFYVKNPQNVLHYGIVKTVNKRKLSFVGTYFPNQQYNLVE